MSAGAPRGRPVYPKTLSKAKQRRTKQRDPFCDVDGWPTRSNHRQSYLSPVVCITQQRSHNQDFKDPRKKAVWGPHAGIMCVLCEGILCARVCVFGCTCLNEHAFRACIRGVVRVRVRLRNVLALEYFTAYSGVCMRICVWWCVLVIQCKRVVVWYTSMIRSGARRCGHVRARMATRRRGQGGGFRGLCRRP